MNKLKCIIIDDDPLITDLVKHYCSKMPEVEYCISCNDPIEGLKLISTDQFDILFLDYFMPKLDGKGLMEFKQDHSKVIMITSHADFAVDSYNYPDIIDYLLKPISFERFAMAIQKFTNKEDIAPNKTEKSTSNAESIMVKTGNKWIPLLIESIQFIKSESNYVTFYCYDKKIMSLMNLKDLEQKLPDHFIRCHRSYIVNMKLVKYFTPEEIGIDSKVVPVSTKYKNVLKEYIDNF